MGAGGRRWRIWPFLKQVYREYTRDNCALMAAAISFYALLSLIPLLLVGLSTLGYVLGSETARQAVFQFLDQFLPPQFGGRALQEYVRANVIDPRGFVGLLGLITWIWTGSMSFTTTTIALNVAWGAQKRRSFVATRLLSIAMMVLVGVLALLSFGATSWLQIMEHFRIPWSGLQPGQFPMVWRVAAWVVPMVVSVLLFLLCYLVLPDMHIGARPALVGAVVAGVLWECAKQGFAVYIANFAHYNKVYGSLGGVVILVMWVYYTAVILLLGAEVAKATADRCATSRKTVRRRTAR